ncbi:restriction endonuclease [Embleya sp. NPDC005971]|uniref:restriction endonuclease n=1 Tax=unclassified Embleya TaxID=2699296 RepID=UPI0033E5974E
MTQPQKRGSTQGVPRSTGTRVAVIVALLIVVALAFAVGGGGVAVAVSVVVGLAEVGRRLWGAHRAARAADERWRHQDAVAAGRRRTLAEVDALTGTQFEELVADLCRNDGCTQVRRVGGSGDNGADVLCRLPDGRFAVIQCKRYAPTRRIAPKEVRDLLGAKTHFAADVAVLVTTGTFSKQSTTFAVDNGILAVHRDFFGLWNQGTPLARLAALNGTGQGRTRRRPKPRHE